MNKKYATSVPTSSSRTAIPPSTRWSSFIICLQALQLLASTEWYCIKIFVFGGLEQIFAFLFFKIALFSKLVLDTFKVSSLPNLCEMNLRLTRFFPHRYVVVSSKKSDTFPSLVLWQCGRSLADKTLFLVQTPCWLLLKVSEICGFLAVDKYNWWVPTLGFNHFGDWLGHCGNAI